MDTPIPIKIYSYKAAKEFREKVTSASKLQGSGLFEVVATNEGVDRDGEVIQVNAWDFNNFLKNPVLLWGHDYGSLPIGAVTSLEVRDGQVIAKGTFANTEFAQEVKQLYDDGFLKSVSVGFIVRERNGPIITKAELLELSFVTVPSNPDALSRVKALEIKYLTTKADEPTVEPPAEILTDGTETLEDEQKEDEKDTIQGDESETPENETEAPMPDSQVPNLLAEYPRASEAGKAISQKVGAVLSAKNRSLVENAIQALQALLDAASPPEKNVGELVSEIQKDAQFADKVLGETLKKFKILKTIL